MSLSKFGGFFSAVDYNFGGGIGYPPALTILTAPSDSPISNPGSVTLQDGVAVLTDGGQFYPLNTNAPVLVGSGSNQETVTPSAVTSPTSNVPGTPGFTATFANIHGQGDPVASATFGLQEAINDAARLGGGVVVVDWRWTAAGGTTAIYNAAVLPSPATVSLQDNRS